MKSRRVRSCSRSRWGPWRSPTIWTSLGVAGVNPCRYTSRSIPACGFFSNHEEEIKHVCNLKGLRVVGIMTHLANADGADLSDTRRQLDAFWALRDRLGDYLPDDVLTHTHNSVAPTWSGSVPPVSAYAPAGISTIRSNCSR